jgi:hypothetical protein
MLAQHLKMQVLALIYCPGKLFHSVHRGFNILFEAKRKVDTPLQMLRDVYSQLYYLRKPSLKF